MGAELATFKFFPIDINSRNQTLHMHDVGYTLKNLSV